MIRISHPLAAVLLLLASLQGGGAELPVTLAAWAGTGSVLPGRNGEDLIRLVAETRWDRAALAANPSRWGLQVTLPEGQTTRQSFPLDSPPGRSRVEILLPASAVRDRLPASVRVSVAVVNLDTNAAASNTLVATIVNFPRPRGQAPLDDPGPFGWGRPLAGPSRVLPEVGPDRFRFARVTGTATEPGFFAATTEASNRQVGERLPGYDPRAGRSDEFTLDAPDQPAVNLTPNQATGYVQALAKADPFHLPYRLPTETEWLRLARAGRAEGFWWGTEPDHPAGVNWLGPEPSLPSDTTAPVEGATRFESNPAGLLHTFGNIAEWATRPDGGFARPGGHFRTEPADALTEVILNKEDREKVGPDPFVGVRPVFTLSAEAGAALIRQSLTADPTLRAVRVAYDPDTATATLTGPVPDPLARRRADERVRPFWFVARVSNLLQPPVNPPGRLAKLGPPKTPARRVGSLGRSAVELALPVEWSDPLPVAGSGWWVNVALPSGSIQSHRLIEGEPARSASVRVHVEGVANLAGSRVALSLGGSAASLEDGRVRSNWTTLQP